TIGPDGPILLRCSDAPRSARLESVEPGPTCTPTHHHGEEHDIRRKHRTADHRGGSARHGQPKQHERRSTRPAAPAGSVAHRETRTLRPRSHPRAPHARQGFGCLRHVAGDPRHQPVHEGGDLQPGRQQLRDVRPVLHGGRRARRRRRRARHPRLRAAVLHHRRQLGRGRQQTPVFFHRDPLKFPDLNRAVKRDPRTNMRDPENNWGFWTNLPESLHQVTITMSDRGIPRSFRHMHGYGSHAYSLIHAEGQRHWVKFHFRTQQGIACLTDAEATELIGRDRESHGRDLYEAIERGDYPKWGVYIQVMPEADAATYRFHPFDLTKVWSQKDYPLIEVGEFELNRNPDNYFADVE